MFCPIRAGSATTARARIVILSPKGEESVKFAPKEDSSVVHLDSLRMTAFDISIDKKTKKSNLYPYIRIYEYIRESHAETN